MVYEYHTSPHVDCSESTRGGCIERYLLPYIYIYDGSTTASHTVSVPFSQLALCFTMFCVAEGILLLLFNGTGLVLGQPLLSQKSQSDYLAGTIRMCSISDNMTAVGITFLIATITSTVLSNSQQSFSTALNAVLQQLPVYSFSFLIVGFYWLSHSSYLHVINATICFDLVELCLFSVYRIATYFQRSTCDLSDITTYVDTLCHGADCNRLDATRDLVVCSKRTSAH